MSHLAVDTDPIVAAAHRLAEAAAAATPAIAAPDPTGAATPDAGLADTLTRLTRVWQQHATAAAAEAAGLAAELTSAAGQYAAAEATITLP